MIKAEASVTCPKCNNSVLDKASDYSLFCIKNGMVRGWRLKCPKCETSYILDEHAYEEAKDKWRNKSLHSVDEVALYLQKSLLEE